MTHDRHFKLLTKFLLLVP